MLRRADDLLSGPLSTTLTIRARDADLVPSVHPATRLPRLPAPHLWALVLITLFGGILRFHHLTHPALWNDETLVFWRVCGTYGEMLGPLHTDGFPPLHYSLYWLLGHPVPVGPDALRPILGWAMAAALTVAAGALAAVPVRRDPSPWVRRAVPLAAMVFAATVLGAAIVILGPGRLFPAALVPAAHTLKLTPWVMRSVPAICGTLTVPAMYFLARQLLPAGASLVAALVTACSAFMLFYSRDAKMYPDAWLLITLNVGCLLMWFRTGGSTPFLAWVATGCGAVGLHPSGPAVPAICVVFLLTQRNLRWPRTVLFLLGLAVIYAGDVVYFTKFNIWNERVDAIGWQASGLGWVGGFFNGNRTGPEHLAYATTAFLAGYEWPRDAYLPQIVQSLQDVPQAVVWEIVALLAVAVLPWPLARAVWRPQRQAARDAALPEPAWRVWLWLGTWIAVPTYAVYCRSVDGFVGPLRWTWELWHGVHPVVWAVAGGAVVALAAACASHRSMRPMLRRLAAFWVVTAALFGLCEAVFVGFAFNGAAQAWMIGQPWGVARSLWEPRYLGFMWPAVGVGVAALLMRLPTRAVRTAAILTFCGLNLLMADLRMRLWTEPPIDRLAADVWAAQDPRGTTRTYDNIPAGGIAVAETNLGTSYPKIAGGRYYLQMLANRPMSPTLFEQSLWPTGQRPFELRENLPVSAVRRDVRTTPTLQHVILWSQLIDGNPQFPDRHDQLTFDPYRSALPASWRLADEQVYPVRVIWDWREKWRWVRREYVRVSEVPAEPPRPTSPRR